MIGCNKMCLNKNFGCKGFVIDDIFENLLLI